MTLRLYFSFSSITNRQVTKYNLKFIIHKIVKKWPNKRSKGAPVFAPPFKKRLFSQRWQGELTSGAGKSMALFQSKEKSNSKKNCMNVFDRLFCSDLVRPFLFSIYRRPCLGSATSLFHSPYRIGIQDFLLHYEIQIIDNDTTYSFDFIS